MKLLLRTHGAAHEQVGRGSPHYGEMWWWLSLGVLTVLVLVLYLFSLRRTYCIKGKHIVVRLPAGLSGMRVEVAALET